MDSLALPSHSVTKANSGSAAFYKEILESFQSYPFSLLLGRKGKGGEQPVLWTHIPSAHSGRTQSPDQPSRGDGWEMQSNSHSCARLPG